MDHSYIDENNLIDRYVRGTMPSPDRAAFEEHFLDCPQCLDQIEVARSLRTAIRAAAADQGPALSQTPPQRSITRWRWWAATATAFLGLMTVTSFLFYQQLDRSRQQVGQIRTASSREIETMRHAFENAQQSPPAVYVLNRSRGAAPARTISLANSPQWIVFTTEADTSQFASYAAVLRDQSGTQVWQANNLQPASPDALSVSIPSTVLSSQRHTLVFQGRDARGSLVEIASFALQVVRQK
jgi:hypothetical protein